MVFRLLFVLLLFTDMLTEGVNINAVSIDIVRHKNYFQFMDRIGRQLEKCLK